MVKVLFVVAGSTNKSLFLRTPDGPYCFSLQHTKGVKHHGYLCLIQFQDQGIRNIKNTVKRGDAAMAEAEKMGIKTVQEYWTMALTTVSSYTKPLMTKR
jgi:hypothetical protein